MGLRRLNMMMLSSVTIVMTRDVTHPMSPTTSLNRRRSVTRTSERTVSLNMRKLLSMRLFKSAELHLSKTVTSRVLRSVPLNMSLSAGPSKRSMTFRMTLLSAKLLLRRSVRMKHLDTPPTQSAPSGQRRSAVSPRRMSRNILQSLDVPRNQESFVPQLVVDSSKELRSVMTKPRLLSKTPPRNSVLLNPKELPSMSPSLPQLRSVLMCPRRSVPDPEPTQERSRSQLSRNGVMCHQRNQALPKLKAKSNLQLVS